MASRSEQWFVRTGFGALLGPMPEDALAEMARTGALLRADQVREGSEGVWHPAGDLPGLFDGVAAPSTQEGTRIGGLLPRAMPDGSFVMAKASELPRRASEVPRSETVSFASEPSSPTVPEAAESEYVPDTFWQMAELDEQRAGQQPPQSANVTESAVDATANSVDVDFLLNSPIESPPPERDVPADEPPLIENLDFGEPSPTQLVEEAPSSAPVSMPRTTTARIPPTAPRLSASKAGLRWSRWLHDWRTLGAAAVMCVMAIWWLWPRQRQDIYQKFVAIHDELQQRRESSTGSAGLKEFAAKASAELDEIIPELEENALNNREQQLLLFLGKDCLQEMLNQPDKVDERHERQFAAFSGRLQDIYAPSRRSADDTSSESGRSSKSSGAVGLKTPHPDSPRGRSGGFNNVAGSGSQSQSGSRSPSVSTTKAATNSGQPSASPANSPRYTGPTKLPGGQRE